MRDLWQTTNMKHGAKLGLATNPHKLQSSGIKRLLERALWEQGLRTILDGSTKRHEWKAVHGFRKYYKSRAEQVMKPINVEITMGHDIGVSRSYWRPRVEEVLEDYLKAESLLTINADEYILQKQVQQLKEKNQVSDNSIKKELSEVKSKLEYNQRKDYDVISALGDRISDYRIRLTN